MENIYLALSKGAVETIIDTLATKIVSLEYNNEFLRKAVKDAETAKQNAKQAVKMPQEEDPCYAD